MNGACETGFETSNRPATSPVLRWHSYEDDAEHGSIISPRFREHPASRRGSAAAGRRKAADCVFRARPECSTPYELIKRWMDFCLGVLDGPRPITLDEADTRNASLGFDSSTLQRSVVPIPTGQGAS